MKHYFLALALAASTSHSALNDTPRDAASCDLVGAIATAVAELHGSGLTKDETMRQVLATLRRSFPPSQGMPPWIRTTVNTAWFAQSRAPDIAPARAGAVLRSMCLAP